MWISSYLKSRVFLELIISFVFQLPNSESNLSLFSAPDLSVTDEEQLLCFHTKRVLNVLILVVDIFVDLFDVLPRLERFF